MRLTNVRDRYSNGFVRTKILEYAIPSHTWEDDETTYKDVVENVHNGKKGFTKAQKGEKVGGTQRLHSPCAEKSTQTLHEWLPPQNTSFYDKD
jgi:hypothetical protein